MIVLFLFSCSKDSDEECYVYHASILKICQDQSTLVEYEITESEWKRVRSIWESFEGICNTITFSDINGVSRGGYHGGHGMRRICD